MPAISRASSQWERSRSCRAELGNKEFTNDSTANRLPARESVHTDVRVVPLRNGAASRNEISQTGAHLRCSPEEKKTMNASTEKRGMNQSGKAVARALRKTLRRVCLALGCAATAGSCLASSRPTAFDQFVDAAANLSTPITLQGSDPNGLPLFYRVPFGPVHGTLSGIPPNLIYTPNLNYLGQDGFVFEVNDSLFTSARATVGITVKHGLSINNISLTEGNSGTKSATFTVTMTVPGSDLALVLVSY